LRTCGFANYSDLFGVSGSQGSDDELGDEDVPFLSALLAELVDGIAEQAAERGDATALRVVEHVRVELDAVAGDGKANRDSASRSGCWRVRPPH